MTGIAVPRPPAVQRPQLALGLVAGFVLLAWIGPSQFRMAALFLVGIGLGFSLYHAAFGFAGAYRAALEGRDASGLIAQIAMLAIAILLFWPVLAAGEAFGRPVAGAHAPVSLSMGFGAFLFGIGMQLASGCASGTLFTAGGGSPRMILVLAFFCLGGFWASLDFAFWSSLPSLGVIALPEKIGWGPAVGLELGLLAVLFLLVRRSGLPVVSDLWWRGTVTPGRLLRGPWPLLMTAGLLALLNLATLLLAGHPWTITWAFALWAAKGAALLGWDPGTSAFWSAPFQANALSAPVLSDVTSVMDIGIVLGAFLAAALQGRIGGPVAIPPRPLAAAILGGLMLGYGARLSYGCNIGAFFSGVASQSLHGWVWIVLAALGNAIGVRLRPFFRL